MEHLSAAAVPAAVSAAAGPAPAIKAASSAAEDAFSLEPFRVPRLRMTGPPIALVTNANRGLALMGIPNLY